MEVEVEVFCAFMVLGGLAVLVMGCSLHRAGILGGGELSNRRLGGLIRYQ